jgi:hypothetical protein
MGIAFAPLILRADLANRMLDPNLPKYISSGAVNDE